MLISWARGGDFGRRRRGYQVMIHSCIKYNIYMIIHDYIMSQDPAGNISMASLAARTYLRLCLSVLHEAEAMPWTAVHAGVSDCLRDHSGDACPGRLLIPVESKMCYLCALAPPSVHCHKRG